jgi:hypothetical protein
MVKQLSSILLSVTLLLGIGFSADVILTIDGDNLNYESTSSIAGFQFSQTDCAVSPGGGDAAAAGFMVSSSPTMVLGFSLMGGEIPIGSGTMLTGFSGCDSDSLSNFIFSTTGGVEISVEMGVPTDACGVPNGDGSSCADAWCSKWR